MLGIVQKRCHIGVGGTVPVAHFAPHVAYLHPDVGQAFVLIQRREVMLLGILPVFLGAGGVTFFDSTMDAKRDSDPGRLLDFEHAPLLTIQWFTLLIFKANKREDKPPRVLLLQSS